MLVRYALVQAVAPMLLRQACLLSFLAVGVRDYRQSGDQLPLGIQFSEYGPPNLSRFLTLSIVSQFSVFKQVFMTNKAKAKAKGPRLQRPLTAFVNRRITTRSTCLPTSSSCAFVQALLWIWSLEAFGGASGGACAQANLSSSAGGANLVDWSLS